MEEGAPRRGVTPRVIAAQVCATLNRSGAKYLVIDGVACILHGYARTTEDVDILIERTEANAGRVLAALARRWSRIGREHAATPIPDPKAVTHPGEQRQHAPGVSLRSEEHTSELQSRLQLV